MLRFNVDGSKRWAVHDYGLATYFLAFASFNLLMQSLLISDPLLGLPLLMY